ncbi:MAG: hypothetical protein HYS12_29365 [Planctomycetes bacterium]|nr:hypothetical protein [Planctomycetota bacterium]
MAQTCHRCSRANPADAIYCFFDGVVLDQGTREGPVNIGAQPFPRPFAFSSNLNCGNFDQFAWTCRKNWIAAVRLLRQGDFQDFLVGMGRLDLSRIAAEAARDPDDDRALDRFLDALPTDVLSRPRLHVEPAKINLGRLVVGQDRTARLYLENQGNRLLFGAVRCPGCAWLSLGSTPGVQRRLVQFLQDFELVVTVCGKALRAATKPLEAELVLETNGGKIVVPVRAEVPVQPFPEGVLVGARSPRELAAKARAEPHAAAALFSSDAVARWYAVNGWSYPIQGPVASGVGGLQQFFEAVGLSTPPRVEVSAMLVNLRGQPGERLEHTLAVSTQERRAVYASAASNQPWLKVGPVEADGRTATIPLVVPSVPGRPGDTHLARVHVRANGNQQFVVSVRVSVSGTGLPRPAEPARPDPGLVVRVSPVPPPEPRPVLSPRRLPEPDLAVNGASDLLAIPEEAPPVSPPPSPPRPVGRTPATPARPTPDGGLRLPRWLHVLPLLLLVLAGAGIVARDANTEPLPPDEPPPILDVTEDKVIIPPVDPDPRIEVRFHEDMRFGVLMRQQQGEPKKLTFSENGLTNNTVLRIDGPERVSGSADNARWLEQEAPLGKTPDGRERIGRRSVYLFAGGVEVAQIVEVVPGDQAVEVKPGEYRRLLNTCLIRYTITNKGTRVRSVGLRFLLDTFIGANDGVPFTVPRQGLVTTFADFDRPEKVPDFIQALERPDLGNPGTIAHLTLRLGGQLEPPNKVRLTHWVSTVSWGLPLVSITENRHDSACVLTWDERALEPGKTREVGFAYGLGNVSTEGTGALGVTLARGVFQPEEVFEVTAYVNKPLPGETLTLELPSGFRLEEGEAKREVPQPAASAEDRRSVVTWTVRAAGQQKNYKLVVRSSRGVAQTKAVIVLKPRPAGEDPGIFR